VTQVRHGRRVRRDAVALFAGLTVGVCGCSHHPAPQAQPSPTSMTSSATPSPTPTRRPAPKPAPPMNPLTGARGVPHWPVLAVKIDNTAAGRPQIGLDAADVVYVEQVEGGATRLVAVFSTTYPRRVGPVRSVRNADPELLSAYGRPGLVFSGGAGGPLATLHRSPIYDLSGRGVYSRDHSRYAPYNLIADLAALRGTSPTVSRPKDVGFRWVAREWRLAKARHAMRMSTQVGRVTVAFGFDPRTFRWVESIGGVAVHAASGARVSTPNVIVQFCRVTVDRTDVDVLGAPSAYTHTVGRGPVVIFRDGRAISGTWVRPKAGAPTRYLDASGRDIGLRPGGAWVLLAASGNPLRYG
jgi:Protein of unknown function (DUF3048) N-terminal domain/Protein of unknown function (DUF3048) C-terminal domain